MHASSCSQNKQKQEIKEDYLPEKLQVCDFHPFLFMAWNLSNSGDISRNRQQRKMNQLLWKVGQTIYPTQHRI